VPLRPDLIDAYQRALYVVFGEPALLIRIGEPNPELDALLKDHEAHTAAFVTAANPHGARLSAAENHAAAEALLKSEFLIGHAWCQGEGRDPAGQWPAEPSVLVIGLSRKDAAALGFVYGQNAIVFIDKGKAPELVIL
jgi:hypothetical protein